MMTRKEVAQLRELAEKARDLGSGIVSLPIGQFFDLLDFLDFQEDEFSDDPIECNLPFERVPQHAWDPGIGPVPPRPKVEPLFPTVDMVTPAEPSPTPQQDAVRAQRYNFDRFVCGEPRAEGVAVHASSLEEATIKAKGLLMESADVIAFTDNSPCPAQAKCQICLARLSHPIPESDGC